MPPALSPVDHQRQVTDEEILDIAGETASDWLKIARRLPDADHSGKLAFKLNDTRLNDLAKAGPNDEERMVQVLSMWRTMRSTHTWGPLRNALYKTGYGAVADQVLEVSRELEGECLSALNTKRSDPQ